MATNLPSTPPNTPLYRRLARRLQERIDAGGYPAGARLPSEPELSAEFGVNRLTVRQAFAELERAGKLRPDGARGAFFTTRLGGEDAPPPPPAGGPAPSQVPAGERPRFFGLALTVGGRRRQRGRREGSGFGTKLKELLLAAADLLRHCTVNQFEVWRGGERMTSLPVLILILLVVLAYWISLPLLVIGLLFGCRYRFSGPDLDRNKVGEVANQVSDSVRDAVGQVREQFKKEFSRSRHRKGK